MIRDQGEKQFRIAKGLAIAEALINVALGITKALSGPFPFLNAAAIAAAGAVQIAAIRRQQPGGAGGVTAPGGAPAAGPGAGDTAGGGSSPGGSTGGGRAPINQTLYIEGISSSEMYSGRQVRELAERLIEYQRQGGVVVLV